jgi:hypothetical protein
MSLWFAWSSLSQPVSPTQAKDDIRKQVYSPRPCRERVAWGATSHNQPKFLNVE